MINTTALLNLNCKNMGGGGTDFKFWPKERVLIQGEAGGSQCIQGLTVHVHVIRDQT